MTSPPLYVKLDEAGHVVGYTNCAPGPTWIAAPHEIRADPMAHRLCPTFGWVRKTHAEHREFERRHTPEPVVDPAIKRIEELERRIARLEWP